MGEAPRESPPAASAVRLPRSEPGPFRLLGVRLAAALGAVLFIAVVVYLGGAGYTDSGGGGVSFLDAVYYATVSMSTTGYGDISPVSDGARLVNILVVTPARVLFLVLLVGTTVEILTERSRDVVRLRRWRKTLRDHVIVCGYGTKGRSAIDALLGKGLDRERIVVIDERPEAIERANDDGLAAVHGNSATAAILRQAGIERATAVVVAPDRDDASVLTTLTARELNRDAKIASAVRETENVHLLRESGADSVITSSGAAGRLLGMATDSPASVEMLEDLLDASSGLEVVERTVRPEETGPDGRLAGDEVLVTVIRDGEKITFGDKRSRRLEPADRIVLLRVSPSDDVGRSGQGRP